MGAPPNHPVARRRDIQGLRAVAVLLVVAFHAQFPAPGGFIGVDVFFVISGFVITGMLYREWGANGRIDFRSFYIRRFQRLGPALALVVGTTVALSVVLLSPVSSQQVVAAQTGLGAMFLAANVFIARHHNSYFDPETVRNPLLHTWSLSVEEQFYLVFPALVVLAWCIGRRRGTRIYPYVAIATASLVSFGLAAFLHEATTATANPRSGAIGAALGFYSPITRFWEFGVGAVVALAANRLAGQPRAIAFICGLAGTVLVLGGVMVIDDSTPFPSLWTLIPVLGAALILVAGSSPANPISRILSLSALVKIGDWSYSIYLWHWPFVLFAATIWSPSRQILFAAAALSFIPAIASYYWVEQPIRAIRRFRGKQATRVAIPTMLVPITICVVTLWASQAGYWSQGIKTMQMTVWAKHATDVSSTQCFVDQDSPVHAQDSVSPCVFNAAAEGRPIYLVGDSTAWHFAEAAIGAGELLGRPVEVVWLPGCAFKNLFMHSRFERRNEACRRGYEATMGWLDSARPGTVVISEINSNFGNRPVGLQADGPERADSFPTAEAAGLVSTIESLKRAGHSVVLVQAVPRFSPPFDPLKCTWSQLRRNDCIGLISRTNADELQRKERAALQQIGLQTGAGLWDPRNLFCSDRECRTQIDGLNLYIDAKHISPDASRMLAPSLAETIGA